VAQGRDRFTHPLRTVLIACRRSASGSSTRPRSRVPRRS
jgi:hypothetical protein